MLDGGWLASPPPSSVFLWGVLSTVITSSKSHFREMYVHVVCVQTRSVAMFDLSVIAVRKAVVTKSRNKRLSFIKLQHGWSQQHSNRRKNLQQILLEGCFAPFFYPDFWKCGSWFSIDRAITACRRCLVDYCVCCLFVHKCRSFRALN